MLDEPLPSFTASEARVLGAMVEKALTTPDNYPMSLNAVTVACNQVSNREPVVEYSDDQVEVILRALADRGIAKMVHRPGDRVVKYRQALDAALGVDAHELAVVAVLLLRGAQTPGELRQRTTRYVAFDSLPHVETTLEGLRSRDLVRRLDRVPGQKENRYLELLSDRRDGAAPAAAETTPAPDTAPDPGEVATLKANVAELTRRFDELTRRLGEDV